MDGGFKAWASSGLRVKPEGMQSPLAILQEVYLVIIPIISGLFLKSKIWLLLLLFVFDTDGNVC